MAAFPITTHYYDIIVIGAGGAGLMATLTASRKGFSVACLTKVHPTRSHTVAAQGGINAALGNVTEDNWHWHMYDTVRGSDWLGDQDAIAFMCRQAPHAIRQLEQMGVPFSRDVTGKIYQRTYGGQSTHFGKGGFAYRACSAADRTGQAILHTLYQQSLAQRCQFFIDYFTLDLIFDQGQCRGVLAWDMAEGGLHLFQAQAVILATGGHGQIYKTNTSSSICTGDGNAMALRAGLGLQDMEFVQFHPTGLYGQGFLITEAARAEGGFLTNAKGERFMQHYAPKYGDLASRDVIARAIATEIAEGRGAGAQKDHVYLNLQHLKAEDIRNKLPTVLETAQTFAGINPSEAPIPVAPSCHYTMGGIPTNLQCEAAPGLLAVGETACVSVHGANRLGCNSLLDIIVFGQAAAEHLATTLTPGAFHPRLPSHATEPALASLANKLAAQGDVSTSHIRKEVQKTMDIYAGVFRNALLLEAGIMRLEDLANRINSIKIRDKSLLWNNELLEVLELHNMFLLVRATLFSAQQRTESRGSHYREDFPTRNDKEWLSHSLVRMDENAGFTFSIRKVRMETGMEGVEKIAVEKRVY